jgi:hypothetical protein
MDSLLNSLTQEKILTKNIDFKALLQDFSFIKFHESAKGKQLMVLPKMKLELHDFYLFHS